MFPRSVAARVSTCQSNGAWSPTASLKTAGSCLLARRHQVPATVAHERCSWEDTGPASVAYPMSARRARHTHQKCDKLPPYPLAGILADPLRLCFDCDPALSGLTSLSATRLCLGLLRLNSGCHLLAVSLLRVPNLGNRSLEQGRRALDVKEEAARLDSISLCLCDDPTEIVLPRCCERRCVVCRGTCICKALLIRLASIEDSFRLSNEPRRARQGLFVDVWR